MISNKTQKLIEKIPTQWGVENAKAEIHLLLVQGQITSEEYIEIISDVNFGLPSWQITRREKMKQVDAGIVTPDALTYEQIYGTEAAILAGKPVQEVSTDELFIRPLEPKPQKQKEEMLSVLLIPLILILIVIYIIFGGKK